VLNAHDLATREYLFHLPGAPFCGSRFLSLSHKNISSAKALEQVCGAMMNSSSSVG
jgi:hypothetical protein